MNNENIHDSLNNALCRPMPQSLRDSLDTCLKKPLREENIKLDKMLSLACVTLSANVGVGMHPTRWLTPEEWRKRIEGWVEK